MHRLLLCTDMDRTVIPNGHQPEDAQARPLFRQLCGLPEVLLVYVTGRDLSLARKAVVTHNLPEPAYLIADVGSRIYQRQGQDYNELAGWRHSIAERWRGRSPADLHRQLAQLGGLRLQEEERQSEVKLSYYADLSRAQEALLAEVEQALAPLGIEMSLIYSVDEVAGVGLLDLLPAGASKLDAIRFLQQHLGYSARELVFAGDSGNDLPVLVSELQTVLVANAQGEVRQQAVHGAESNGTSDSLFCAKERDPLVSGNYSGGVLQGVLHFLPEFACRLKTSER